MFLYCLIDHLIHAPAEGFCGAKFWFFEVVALIPFQRAGD